MDFLKKFTEATKLDTTKETPTATSAPADDHPPSQTELFASAQVVAEAAKSAINRDPTNVDNYKLAGATADILDAAEHYGKLDSSSGIGSYVEKAEDYLKKYESSNSTLPKSPVESEPKSTTLSPPPPAEASEETHETKASPPPPPAEEASEKKEEVIEEKTAPAAETAPSSESPAGDEKSEGGIGDYVKKAEGLLDKEGGDSGSGYGGALKAAGDFWKKN